jgi:arachidonate 5-lipoxygenase
LLSMKGTKSLGDFEVQYLYDPKVVQIADKYGAKILSRFLIHYFCYRFRLELKKLSTEIKERNRKREFKYEWFDPEIVPNSISI